jgi:hypothetical protein
MQLAIHIATIELVVQTSLAILRLTLCGFFFPPFHDSFQFIPFKVENKSRLSENLEDLNCFLDCSGL